MNLFIMFGSFVLFTGLVALVTYLMTRKEDISSESGYFLAGRSLTFPLIAGSLLLTNLSTEQLVGLNADAFTYGLSVMVWEVAAVVALIAMGLFFLPKFLSVGITTVPQFLEIRFDSATRTMTNLIFLIAYTTILLPIVLYTGASGLLGIIDLKTLTGIESQSLILWIMVWFVGIVGACYALFGGLRSVAISDTFNAIGLLIGGFLITFLGLSFIGGDGGISAGVTELYETIPSRLNSIGGSDAPVPFSTIFTGVLIINLFYWCTNQQIIQRTLGASSLAEGQKGVFLCAFLKLLGPIYLVLPGIIAYYIFVIKGNNENLNSVNAYGALVRTVLPAPLVGFFTAAMVGAILSSFNSALNSTCTLFSLGIYKNLIRKDASDEKIVKVGKYFGMVVTIISMIVAPLLAGQDSIFGYLQTMNGVYFIPIFSIVLAGLIFKKVPAFSAKISLIFGVVFIPLAYFLFPKIGFDLVNIVGGYYHFIGIVFIALLLFMFICAKFAPTVKSWQTTNSDNFNLTPWKFAKVAGVVLFIIVVLIYWFFADFSVLK